MRVFWSRCGHGYGNFGDKLTPLFLDYFQVRYEWALPENADLIGIGSLVEKIPDKFTGVVWTSGSMFESTSKSLREAEVLAVRGRLTLERIQTKNKESVVLGDGGLICDLFYEPAPKKFRLGLVPHFADRCHPLITQIASSNPAVTVIDVCAPTLDVIQRIGECEFILSSSLHGLIVADSLGVPNHWIDLGADTVSGAGFKFRDYYSNFGITNVCPLQVSGRDTIDSLCSQLRSYQRPGIAQLKGRLRESMAALISGFGADPGRTLSLDELRKRENQGAAEFNEWNEQKTRTVELLKNTIPAGERFLLIDEEQIRDAVTHAPAVRFLERNGEYWGAPSSDLVATQEMNKHVKSGIRFVAVAWPAFWWLDEFPTLKSFLADNCEQIVDHSDAQIFRIQ